jgi:hypothetical protein
VQLALDQASGDQAADDAQHGASGGQQTATAEEEAQQLPATGAQRGADPQLAYPARRDERDDAMDTDGPYLPPEWTERPLRDVA